MSSEFRKELQERFPEHTIQQLETTKHHNVLRLVKDGSPNLVAKTIWHDAEDPHGDMGIEAQDKAYDTEVKILTILPKWWKVHYIDHFKTEDNRIIVTNELNNVPWASYKNNRKTDKLVAQELFEQIRWLRSHKIAHNDLELKNILLTQSGSPVIIDFEKSSIDAIKKQMDNDCVMLLENLGERPNTKPIGILLDRLLKNANSRNRRTRKVLKTKH